MSTSFLVRVLLARQALRRRERWSRAQLDAFQRRQLAEVRTFASTRSPYYRQVHTGLERAPLHELPVLTKAGLMDNFDRLSTDRAVQLSAVQAYLEVLAGEELFDGRYWVSATSGSSGRRSVIPSNGEEWATVIASYARANEWSGVIARLRHRTRLAVVSSTTAWHQSSRVAATVRSPLVLSERIDAASPLPDVVRRLNRMRPEVLVGYASMIRTLAAEQLDGRLRIAPRAVNSSSEVLTDEAREMATRAWRVPPFNVYAATETGGVAAECDRHLGMHLFEDLIIPEVVDDGYRHVAEGQTGTRLLVTVLFSRTIPLIRYEMTDRVRLATRRCPCGRPFRLVERIEGRTDDVLTLPGSASGQVVEIHPVVFHKVLDLLDAAGWQVRQDHGGLHLLVAAPGSGVEPSRVESDVLAALSAAGAAPTIVRISVVDSIPAGPAGKRPLVVAAHARSTDAPRDDG